jgi:oligopeptide transport system ATP-binding protein
MSDKLLEVRNLRKYFEIKQGLFKKVHVKAVDDVSFEIKRGETLGLVGESGCGKTTLGRCVLQITKPTSGEIFFQGQKLEHKGMKDYRKKMQIVFQDPYASLDPRKTVADIIGEGLDIHKMFKNKVKRRERILELMDLVGLNKKFYNRYPHEFSGGQRQRIGIARAVAVSPEFIVCDEPVSALDVSIQAQVINMLEKLQNEYGLTYLFIAHDLAVVKHISDRIGVLYLGHLVEIAESEELCDNPRHPYTQMLLSAVPIADPDESERRQREKPEGEIPSPINPPSGCPFRTRCKYVTGICSEKFPEFTEVSPGHMVACFHHTTTPYLSVTKPATEGVSHLPQNEISDDDLNNNANDYIADVRGGVSDDRIIDEGGM